MDMIIGQCFVGTAGEKSCGGLRGDAYGRNASSNWQLARKKYPNLTVGMTENKQCPMGNGKGYIYPLRRSGDSALLASKSPYIIMG